MIWSVFQDFQHHTPSPGWSVLRLCLGNLCCPTGCSFCSTAILALSVLFSSSSMFLMALLSSSVAPWSEWPSSGTSVPCFGKFLWAPCTWLSSSWMPLPAGLLEAQSVQQDHLPQRFWHWNHVRSECSHGYGVWEFEPSLQVDLQLPVSCCCFSPALTKEIKHFAVCFAVWWKRSLHRWPLR